MRCRPDWTNNNLLSELPKMKLQRITILYSTLFVAISLLSPLAAMPLQDSISELKTVAESSDYKATSTYAEILRFVDRCCSAEHVTRHDFGQSVEGRAMVSTIIANPPYSIGDEDERLKILLLGNIHSGECAGKEALLAMLRELAADAEHPWLKDAIVVIAPNYNVDANQRVGLYQRRGQVGPELGMGQRENAMQLDLNRDFCKLESPEARSLVGLIDQFDPHMFIDCHTTNGSRHQYRVTYDIPHNPTAHPLVRGYLRNNMMPAVTRKMEQEDGLYAFYYGNFSRERDRWSTYGHEPRYSTEYVGLRGRLGILSEAYSYATYRERIEGTDSFVRQCVKHVLDNKEDVKELLMEVRSDANRSEEESSKPTLVHLNSAMSAFDGKFTIKGFEGDQKKDYEVTFFGDFTPTTTVEMPFAYVLPAEMSLHAERLQMHGVEIETVSSAEPVTVDGTVYTVTAINRQPRQFQKHNMVSLEATAAQGAMSIEPGSFLIRTGQPLGRLVSYMLEPETNEGLVTWNFLDPWLNVGAAYPIRRIESSVELKTEKVTEIQPGRTLRLADIFGPNKLPFGDLSLSQVQWLADGKTYTVEKNGRRIAVDAESGGEIPLPLPFQAGQVAGALSGLDGAPNRAELSALFAKGIQLRGAEQRLFVLEHDGKTFVFDSETEQAIRLGDGDANAELADLNPAGDKVAFVKDNNLFVMGPDLNAAAIAITSDGGNLIFNGKLDWVYQEELYGRGNFKAFWWAPDGNSIAFLRTDEEPVASYIVTDHIPVKGRHEVTAYPKAGDPLPNVTMAVYNLDGQKTTWVKLPEQPNEPLNELLISRVTWSESAGTLFVQIQNRVQTWLDLCQVDPDSGELSVLFRDETPAWIKTPGDPLFLDDGSFLWLSPRSGLNSIYRYGANGNELAKLTNDIWEVRDLLGSKNGVVYFMASPDSPVEVVPMKVNLDGSDITKLVEMPGSYSAKFNNDFTWFLCEHSTATKQDEILLYRNDGQQIRNVLPNYDDQLRHLAVADPEFLQIPIGEEDQDGVLDAMLIKPADYDADKAYPVVVHVYGGPQTPRVRNRFGGQTYMWHQHLAQQGYLVFIVDNRSASYRSIRQAWPIHGDLARRELADVEWAIGWLKQSHKIDAERIGLWGWSYGGYMTAYALTHSKTFCCGIAGAPVTDWRNYDAIYTERFMRTPQQNQQGYSDSSVLGVADNLHGDLLLIHGTIDDNVHISNTMQFVKALQKAGKQFELMVYPENRHSVRDPDQRLHMHELMTGFLNRNLKSADD